MINRWRQGEGNSLPFLPAGLATPKQHNTRFKRSSLLPLLSLIVALPSVLAIAGCGANAAKTSQSQAPVISLTMTQVPPTSLTVGGTVSVSATVSNDIAHEGVDWVATCASAPNCGSFSPPHTPSGGTTVFTAPLAVPAHNTLTINALSTTDRSKAFSATLTITSTITGVVITQLPPATAPSGSVVTAAATVAGDPSNEGLDWKATCGTVDCTPPGAQHSAPGAAFTFVVPGPAQIPTIVGTTVTLTAFATADHSFTASASFAVIPPVSISVTQPPPSTMVTNATATVIATVSDDPTNAGVDWSVSCFAANNSLCGSVSPAHSASGASVTFTAPAAVASNPTVIITAKSTASSAVSATATVTIVNPVSVQIKPGVPLNSIIVNTSDPLVATVSNDPSNAGVDWTVTCSTVGACGSFSLTHTPSGATTTYTAPSAVPPGQGGTVIITATSTADSTKTATQTVTVTKGVPPNSLLNGNFILLLTAKSSLNGPYAIGGFISADGQGNVTGGYVDLADASGNGSQDVPVLASTYSIGPDGRGQIQLQLSATAINGGSPFGVSGSGLIPLSVVFANQQHALVSETDSFGAGTGTLDLQNATDLAAFVQLGAGAWQQGIYSLRLSGSEASNPYPGYFVVAAVQIDFSSSHTYIADQSANGAITSASSATPVSGHVTFSFDQQKGKLTFTPVNLGLPTQFNLDGWLIDKSHFVITDWQDSAFGTPPFIAGGYLTAQPSSPSLSGPFAFTAAGATAAPAAHPQVAGGILTCGSTGVLDVVPLAGSVTSNASVTASCTPPANGRGVITISGSSSGVSQFAAYPTLDQGWNLIELDGGSLGTSGPSSAGVALPQTLTAPISASAFTGAYAANFTATTAPGSESFAAQIISDGVSALSGTADVNSFTTSGSPSSGATLTGTFTAATNGRFPLALTMTGQPVPQVATVDPVCYVLDANTCLLLGLDASAPGTGILQLQKTGL